MTATAPKPRVKRPPAPTSITPPGARKTATARPLATVGQLRRLELKLEELARGRGGPVAEIAEALLDALFPDD